MSDNRASPVCGGAAADDAYMGYASRDEILGVLNELLEAERAGTRVARHSRKDALGPTMRARVDTVRNEEALVHHAYKADCPARRSSLSRLRRHLRQGLGDL